MHESDAPKGYRPDDPFVVCQRSGYKFRLSETCVEWTGLRVAKRYAEPKHPSLDIPPIRGEEVNPGSTGIPIEVEIG